MKAGKVVEIIHQALRKCRDPHINDVTIERSHGERQIILTTDDGRSLQTWVISESDILETDPPED